MAHKRQRPSDILASTVAVRGKVDAERSSLDRTLWERLQEDFHACDYKGRTLLHLAAMEGELETVLNLTSAGVNINANDRCGEEPLKFVGTRKLQTV